MSDDEARAEYRKLLGEKRALEVAIVSAERELARLLASYEVNSQKLAELREEVMLSNPIIDATSKREAPASNTGTPPAKHEIGVKIADGRKLVNT